MAITLKANTGRVDLTTKAPTGTGENGGYYTPSVTDGILSWEPSKLNMPEVPNSDITGPQGPKGDPFTYDDFTKEQLAALVGPQGPKGDKGDKGDPGENGTDGNRNDEFVTSYPTTLQAGKNYWLLDNEQRTVCPYMKQSEVEALINEKYTATMGGNY